MANDSHHQNRIDTRNVDLSPSSECIAWLTVLNIEAVAIVIMNALTIIIYLKERILRKRSMYLVISLAVADMFVACNLTFDSLILVDSCNLWTINQFRSFELLIVYVCLRFFFPLASVTNLAAISLERMHATFRPFKHRLIKKKIFGAAVAGVWFTAALSTAIVFSLFFPGLSDITPWFKRVLVASYFSLLLCCLFIMVVSYSSIATKFYCGMHPQHHGAIRRERKLTKTLFIVTIVSLILVTPFTIFYLYLIFSPGGETISYHTRLHLSYSLHCLFYGNSLINPLLYALKMPEFKRALFLLLRCRSRSEPV